MYIGIGFSIFQYKFSYVNWLSYIYIYIYIDYWSEDDIALF